MSEEEVPKPEAEELESLIDELGKQTEVREIAGWESGFPALSQALNGILPGLYLLIGPPGCGKTSFSKQLLDQVAMKNRVPGLFVSLTEKKKELRIRTLARLSGLENREIRRGSGYLLHAYGAPKAHYAEVDQLSPSWAKLRGVVGQARSWLQLIYLTDYEHDATLARIVDRITQIKTRTGADSLFTVVDDSQRLAVDGIRPENQFSLVARQLQEVALRLRVAILAIWPELRREQDGSPYAWAEKVAATDVMFVMRRGADQRNRGADPQDTVELYVVRNRGGERGKLSFYFYPGFSRFVEIAPS